MTHYDQSRKEEEVINSFWEGFTGGNKSWGKGDCVTQAPELFIEFFFFNVGKEGFDDQIS